MDTTRNPPFVPIIPRADAVRAAQVQTRHPGVDSWAWAAQRGATKQHEVQKRGGAWPKAAPGRKGVRGCHSVGCPVPAGDHSSRWYSTPGFSGRKEGGRDQGLGAQDYWPVCPCPPWLLGPQGQHCPQDALAETEVHRPHSSGVSSSRDGTVDLCAAEVQEHTARPSWAPLRPWGPGPTSSTSASGSPHTSQSRAVDCGYPGAASSSPSNTFQYSWPRKK